MLTIFTIPKPFIGHINIIQRNAIQSWLKLRSKCEVILFGDDEGVAEAAKEFGISYIPEIEKNEFGTPLLNSAFNIAQKIAKNNILVYTNGDIIFTSALISAVQQIKKPLFLMSGRCWNLETEREINFNNANWEKDLRNNIARKGKLHRYSKIDYVIFPRNLLFNIPPFAVGRAGWDNWLIYHIRSLKIPVIDATEILTVLHQKHDYSHSPYGKGDGVGGPEEERSLKLAGGLSNMLTLRDADWILTSSGLTKPPFPRRIFSELSLFYLWRLILDLKRRFKFNYEK